MLFDIRVPCANICVRLLGPKVGYLVDKVALTIERTLVGDVVHQQDAHSPTVVSSCDGPKPFLSCGVPLGSKLTYKERLGKG